MKGMLLEGFGGVENFRLVDLPDPVPGKNQVLIRVRAAGVNFSDVLYRHGRYPGCRVPHLLGYEVAGEVVDTGEGVTGLLPGQRVLATMVEGGGYAELALAHAASVFPIPENITNEEAASVPVVFATVYHAMVTFGRVEPGERVLIHAAGGGVGTVAVQWAKALGAEVIATAGSDEKLRRVRELGADVLINYRTQNLTEAVKVATGGKGVDVVLDSIGGSVLAESLNLLRPFGRLVTLGVAGGEAPPIDPVRLLSRNLTVSGLFLKPMPWEQVRKAVAASLNIITSGKVLPVVGHVFNLEQVGEAHALMEGRGSFGKIVLRP